MLALLVGAMLGPWIFDLINVPAQYPCDFRLVGDFCGVLLSGFWSFLRSFSSVSLNSA